MISFSNDNIKDFVSANTNTFPLRGQCGSLNNWKVQFNENSFYDI